MQRICHMTSGHNSNDTRIFYKECVSLSKAGYEVYLIATGESREEAGVQIVGIGKRPDGRVKRMTQTAKKIYEKALTLHADIYHFHDPELLPYGVKLAKKGYKVIWDSHEEYTSMLDNKSYIPKPIRKTVAEAFRKYYFSILHYFVAVIVASPNDGDKLKKHNKRIVTVTNYPIVTDEEKADISSTVSFPEDDSKEKAIVFAGGVGEQWRHKEIITALEYCPNVKYVLCGNSIEGYLDELKQLPAWGQVDYRGKVPFTEVNNILKRCSVGMSVIKYSGNTDWKTGRLANTKLYEEMQAGLPVICTDLILWKETIDKYQCGICVNPLDPKEIAKAINYLIENPEKAREMGQSGKQAVFFEYNWATQEKTLLKLYQYITNDK